MDFKTLYERIDGHPVIVDENMIGSNLLQFLNTNHIPWRHFRKGITDKEIERHLLPNEIVITADRRFAYKLQERAILIPLAKSHYHQIESLARAFSRKGGNPWANVDTCPICAVPDLNLKELTFWDEDHYYRHLKNPHITLGQRRFQ